MVTTSTLLTTDKHSFHPIHPVYGALDTWVVVELSNHHRQDLISFIQTIDKNDAHTIIKAEAELAIASIYDYDKSFIISLDELRDPENRWLVNQILTHHYDLEREFNDALNDCLEELEAFWQGHKLIGNDSAKDLYKRLEENYARGWLTESLAKAFEEERETKSRIFREGPYIPHKIIRKTWNAYSDLRSSIVTEHPIGYDAIQSYTLTQGIKLTPLEVSAIRLMDNKFLSARSKSLKDK